MLATADMPLHRKAACSLPHPKPLPASDEGLQKLLFPLPRLRGKGSGDGVKQLLRLSVGEDSRVSFDEALRVFRSQYLAHCLDRTTFYPGVEQALVHFERKRKAVATNKSIEYTNVILNGLGAHHFQCVVGGDRGFGLKPEPGMLLHVMEQLNVSKEQTVLVGDSTNDINGGHNAGIRVCAVGYGMGNRAKMKACRPDWFIERPEQLMELFV